VNGRYAYAKGAEAYCGLLKVIVDCTTRYREGRMADRLNDGVEGGRGGGGDCGDGGGGDGGGGGGSGGSVGGGEEGEGGRGGGDDGYWWRRRAWDG